MEGYRLTGGISNTESVRYVNLQLPPFLSQAALRGVQRCLAGLESSRAGVQPGWSPARAAPAWRTAGASCSVFVFKVFGECVPTVVRAKLGRGSALSRLSSATPHRGNRIPRWRHVRNATCGSLPQPPLYLHLLAPFTASPAAAASPYRSAD